MQFQKFDDALISIRKRLVEQPCSMRHRAPAARQEIGEHNSAANSTMTIADASIGSRNPAEKPTAAQVRTQNSRRYPGATDNLRNARSGVDKLRARTYS